MKDIDKELDTQIDEPDILQELFENYHIVKYDNIDGYTRLGDSESDWYELYTSIKALIATQINQARIDELITYDQAIRSGEPWVTYIEKRIAQLRSTPNE